MYRVQDTKSNVESFAVGPHGVITFGGTELSENLDNLDLYRYFKDDMASVRMQQYGHVLCFFVPQGESLLYDMRARNVVYEGLKQKEKDNFYGVDLTPLGFMASAITIDKIDATRLINIGTGTFVDLTRSLTSACDSGKYLFEKSLSRDHFSRIDLEGNTLWELLSDGKYQNSSLKPVGSKIKIVNVIGESEGKLWYQEDTGHVCAADIETGELILRLGEDESVLPGYMKQNAESRIKNKFQGTFTYRFSKDKTMIYGMGGSLFTQINMKDANPIRHVIDCSATLGESGMRLGSCWPDYPEEGDHFIICDSRGGKIGALEKSKKALTWFMDMAPHIGNDGITHLVEFEEKLYVLAQPFVHKPGTLVTLEKT